MKYYFLLLLSLLFCIGRSTAQTVQVPINAYGVEVVEDAATYQKIVAADENNIFLDMRDVTPDAQFAVKYAGNDNIAGRPLYKSADIFMRKPAALALKEAHEKLKKQGYGLRYTDGYRPYDISVYFFVTVMDTTFVPHPKYGSRHNRGMAIDLTLFHLESGEEVEMPSAIDETTERSYHSFMDTTPDALKHRKLLRETLESVGFEHYPYEWWHYDFEGWDTCNMYNLWHQEIREANQAIEASQRNEQELMLGTSFDLYSEVLDDKRTLYLSLPKNYGTSGKTYPVLYVLDGNWQHDMVASIAKSLATQGALIPEMIVVSIGFKDRMKEFVFEETKHLKNNIFDKKGGAAAQFLEAITKDIIPFVEENYRTNSFKLLHGHSLGGYFTSNIFLNQPELFNGYFAISPSLQMNNFEWLVGIEEKLKTATNKKTFFQLSLGNEGDSPYFEAWEKLTEAIEQNPKSDGYWHYFKDTTNNHGSIPLISTYEGLRNIFKDYNFELASGKAYQTATFEQAKAHYKKLSERYGYIVNIPVEITLNRLNDMMQKGKVTEALTFLDEQIKIHPNAAYLYLLKSGGVLQLEGPAAAQQWIIKAMSVANADEKIVIEQIIADQLNSTKK